jgi:hypothetical protein
MVFAGGHVSGGHFNPAVSTAVFLRGRMARSEFGAYVATQFAATVIAGFVMRYVRGRESHAIVASSGRMLVARGCLRGRWHLRRGLQPCDRRRRDGDPPVQVEQHLDLLPR